MPFQICLMIFFLSSSLLFALSENKPSFSLPVIPHFIRKRGLHKESSCCPQLLVNRIQTLGDPKGTNLEPQVEYEDNSEVLII